MLHLLFAGGDPVMATQTFPIGLPVVAGIELPFASRPRSGSEEGHAGEEGSSSK
jgi:hypothetical protein